MLKHKKKIFITGASGGIGHYIMDLFLEETQYELHLLVRDPKRLRFNADLYDHITCHIGNMEFIEQHQDIISQCSYLIHIATDWSDSTYADKLNVEKTLLMFSYCSPDILEKIVYFSTASILGPGNVAVEAAETFGTGYVRSKYLAHKNLPTSPVYSKIVTVFPTLVFCGDADHPFSHISSGVVPALKYAKWLRFFSVDSGFHFLHGRDIARVTKFLLLNPTSGNEYVLGNASVTADQVMDTICQIFGIKVFFKLPIRLWMIKLLAKSFRIKIAPWDWYCITHPHMIYDTVSPSTFGIKTAFPTLESVLMDIKHMSDEGLVPQ